MNAQRRKQLQEAIGYISKTRETLEVIRDEEQEAFDNLPEGLQEGEKGQQMETAISSLEEAIGNLETAESDAEGALRSGWSSR